MGQRFHRFGDGVYGLTIWEAPGQLGYAMIRALLYQSADVIVICFAIANDPNQGLIVLIQIYWEVVDEDRLKLLQKYFVNIFCAPLPTPN